MDLVGIIHGLLEEKKRLDKMIFRLEVLQSQQTADQVRSARPGKRGRKSMSAEERKVVAERMRKYWEARRASPGEEPSS